MCAKFFKTGPFWGHIRGDQKYAGHDGRLQGATARLQGMIAASRDAGHDARLQGVTARLQGDDC